MKSRVAFCSITTINYSAGAAVLAESLKAAGHNEVHYVLIVDDPEHKYAEQINKMPFKAIYLEELAIPGIHDLIAKYSAYEISSDLKPFFINWLLKRDRSIEILFFMDSDIQVFNRFDAIIDYLETNKDISVALVPHVNNFEVFVEYDKRDDYFIESENFTFGLYNGGFYAVKNDTNSHQFLAWQMKKLSKFGYSTTRSNMFVDQKLLDIAPMLFPFFGVYRNASYNIAHWNYVKGLIKEVQGKYYVVGKPLVFYHFSQLPKSGDIISNFKYQISEEDKNVFQNLVRAYRKRLSFFGQQVLETIPYGYEGRYKKPSLEITDPMSFRESLGESIERTLRKSLSEAMNVIEEQQALENAMRRELSEVYASRVWRMARILRKIAETLIPNIKLRRKLIIVLFKTIKYVLRVPIKILGFTKILFLPKPKVKIRSINLKSKKILYVGHYFHQKTKSTKFLTDLLRTQFEVESVADESFIGKMFPDLSKIDESYLAVIFFQSFPPKNVLRSIKNDNIVYCPMFDNNSTADYAFWAEKRDLKIINFSSTLHSKIAKWGLNSHYWQYFPKPVEFVAGDPKQVFFWQRRSEINFNNIKKLFENSNVKIHIHRAVDPYHEFVRPSSEDEKKFQITYSDWFENKIDLENLIMKCGIYVAPRQYEGIGMSFLEAMSMGKAVVAVDNPTMNEYIEDGKTGYLFDLSKPKPIDFSEVVQVQKNTHAYMKAGYERWIAQQGKVIDFIREK